MVCLAANEAGPCPPIRFAVSLAGQHYLPLAAGRFNPASAPWAEVLQAEQREDLEPHLAAEGVVPDVEEAWRRIAVGRAKPPRRRPDEVIEGCQTTDTAAVSSNANRQVCSDNSIGGCNIPGSHPGV